MPAAAKEPEFPSPGGVVLGFGTPWVAINAPQAVTVIDRGEIKRQPAPPPTAETNPEGGAALT